MRARHEGAAAQHSHCHALYTTALRPHGTVEVATKILQHICIDNLYGETNYKTLIMFYYARGELA